ncbi:MAG: UbiA family prenyltransferase [Candidatus Zixiibacteriota bacterium]
MKLVDIIWASRPLLHLPVWSIYLVALKYHNNLSGDSFDWIDLVMLAGLSFSAAAAYYVNQIYDFETDRINRKVGFLQSGILEHIDMMKMYILMSVLSLVTGALVSPLAFAIFLVLFVLGFIYSVPPLRLKDRPVSGLLANAIGFGFLISIAVMPGMNFHNAGLLGWDNPFYFALTVGSIYLLTTIPDKKGDALAGKRTLGVVLPQTVVLLMALILVLASAYIAYYSRHVELVYLSMISAVTIIGAMILRRDEAILIASKLPILLLTLLAGYFFWGYLLFIVAIIFSARIYYKKRFGIVYPKLA